MSERTKIPRKSRSFASKWDAIFGNPFMQTYRRSAQPHGVGEQKRCLHAPTPPGGKESFTTSHSKRLSALPPFLSEPPHLSHP